MNDAIAFVSQHHTQLVYAVSVIVMMLNFGIKLALNARPLQDWVALAQKRPRIAALVRLLEAVGINPISVVQSIIDLLRNQASPGTVAAAKAIAVSASSPLIAPQSTASTRDTLPEIVIRPKIDVDALKARILSHVIVNDDATIELTVKEVKEIIAFVQAHP